MNQHAIKEIYGIFNGDSGSSLPRVSQKEIKTEAKILTAREAALAEWDLFKSSPKASPLLNAAHVSQRTEKLRARIKACKLPVSDSEIDAAARRFNARCAELKIEALRKASAFTCHPSRPASDVEEWIREDLDGGNFLVNPIDPKIIRTVVAFDETCARPGKKQENGAEGAKKYVSFYMNNRDAAHRILMEQLEAGGVEATRDIQETIKIADRLAQSRQPQTSSRRGGASPQR